MKQLRKYRWLLLLVVGSCILAVGITLAFMFKKSDTVINKLIPARVTCDVQETFDGTYKSAVKVKNTGNIDAYLRLRLVSYWVNSSGQIVGKASEMPVVSYNTSEWEKDSGSDTYYYKGRVSPGNFTTDLLNGTTMELKTGVYHNETVYQVVEIFADAIQADPFTDYATAWETVK